MAKVQSIRATRLAEEDTAERHTLTVRVTHWIFAFSFLGLVVSGIAILIAHPRLYWGETGNMATDSFLDLPLTLTLSGQNGWGRSLHFLSAWIAVAAGAVYFAWGLRVRHFQRRIWPTAASLKTLGDTLRSHLRLKRPAPAGSYNPLQRSAYAAVIFVMFPFAIWTGLAMSPALVSVVPFLVDSLGGHQSARTLHFFISLGLLVFLLVHVAMVILAGFGERVSAMIHGGKR